MKMKLYVDVFFVLNAGMNLVILLMQSLLMQKSIRVGRLLLASIFGAIAACVFVVFSMHRNLVLLIIMYFLASIFLIRIAYGKTTFTAMIRNIFFYYIFAFVLAGLLLQMQKVFHFPMMALTILIVMAFLLLLLIHYLPKLKMDKERISCYYRLRMYDKGMKIEGIALLDTGNGLYDAISKKPVMLGNKKFLESLWKDKDPPIMRMIPYHSVGKRMGLLHAFQPDKIEIERQNLWVCIERPWVAICEECVSLDGEYEMILHPDMLINEKGKEK